MLIHLTPVLIDECEPAMHDATGRHSQSDPDPSDPVYRTLAAAIDAGKQTKRGITIDVTAPELAELRSRFDYLAETAIDNLGWEGDRHHWLGRLNAARAFLRKYPTHTGA